MNHNPKLSIIIPVYNTEKYVEQCLESLLKQTYKNIELINSYLRVYFGKEGTVK